MVASHVYPDAKELLDAHLDRGLSDRERRSANTVVDLDAEETTCPACLTTVKFDGLTCPECGLRLG